MKTCIFDLDGTILDTLSDLTDSCNHALSFFGYPERDILQIRAFVGNGIRNLIGKAVPEGTPEEETAKVFAEFKKHYTVHCNDKTKPYAGICELLEKLKKEGFELGVVSNKSDASVKTLVGIHFGEIFTAVCGEKEGILKKPAPDSTFAVMDIIGAKKDECVFIGDSDVDIKTAENAGVFPVTVTWGFRDRDFLMENGARSIADTPDELYERIKEILD